MLHTKMEQIRNAYMWKFTDKTSHPHWNFVCSREFNKAFINHIDEMLSEKFSSTLEMQITEPNENILSILGTNLIDKKYKTIKYVNWTYKPNFLHSEIVENIDNIKINICKEDLIQTRIFLASMNHDLVNDGFKDIWNEKVIFWTNCF